MSTTRTRTAATLALYVTERRDGEYYHLNATAVWLGPTPSDMARIDGGERLSIDSDRVRNVSQYDYQSLRSQLDLDSLQVSSQGGGFSTRDGRELYGWEVRYRDVYSVDVRRAERMAKTLRAIERRMEQASDKFGRPASYGAFVLRVADAIGASRIVFDNGTNGTGGWGYEGRTHRIMELRDGGATIDRLAHAWAKEGQPESAAS